MVCKVVGVCFSVAGGLICGKEGPLVHTGSVVAVILCELKNDKKTYGFPELNRFNNDREKRDFVSIGAAAGVSAAFGAPLGGVLFSLEEASTFWSVSLTWRTFLSSMLSSFILNILSSAWKGQPLSKKYKKYFNKKALITLV